MCLTEVSVWRWNYARLILGLDGLVWRVQCVKRELSAGQMTSLTLVVNKAQGEIKFREFAQF